MTKRNLPVSMSLAPLLVIAGALTTTLWTAPARADVCDDAEGGLMLGPVPASLQGGSLGAPRRACPRTTVFTGVSGGAIVEPENFYGNLGGSLAIGGSYAFNDRVELYGSIEPVMYQQLISAFTADFLGVGHTSVGATWQALSAGDLVVGATTRLTLPPPIGLYQNAWPIGLDAGVVFTLSPWEPLRLYGEAGGLGTVMVGGGDPLPRAGLFAVGGAELVFWNWASLVAEAKALALYEDDLDHLTASLALRARIWAGLGAELYAGAPVAGRERTLATFGLRVGYRF
jgi:hypothetical protein